MIEIIFFSNNNNKIFEISNFFDEKSFKILNLNNFENDTPFEVYLYSATGNLLSIYSSIHF